MGSSSRNEALNRWREPARPRARSINLRPWLKASWERWMSLRTFGLVTSSLFGDNLATNDASPFRTLESSVARDAAT
jgi:hypothetical protein